MNYKDIVFLDFETTGVNPHTCQPTELAAVVIDGRKLEIKDKFTSLIKPELDEAKCLAYNLTPLSEEVLRITNIDRKELEKANSLEFVWQNFVTFINKACPSKNKFQAPIMAGFNVDGYDKIIINRIAGGHFWAQSILPEKHLTKTKASGIKLDEPWGFGPWDASRSEQGLFNTIVQVDLMDIFWTFTEDNIEVNKLNMKTVRDFVGIDQEGAHRALKDVEDGASVLINFLNITRQVSRKINFRKR